MLHQILNKSHITQTITLSLDNINHINNLAQHEGS